MESVVSPSSAAYSESSEAQLALSVGGHGQAQRRAQGRDEGVLARRAGLPQQLQPKVAQGRIQRRVAAGRSLRGRPAGLERRDACRAGAQQQGHRQCKR